MVTEGGKKQKAVMRYSGKHVRYVISSECELWCYHVLPGRIYVNHLTFLSSVFLPVGKMVCQYCFQ